MRRFNRDRVISELKWLAILAIAVVVVFGALWLFMPRPPTVFR